MISLRRFCDNASNLISNIYLFLMLCIYPFYMTRGYVGLSDAKYSFFLTVSLVAVILLLASGFPKLITSVKDGRFNGVHGSLIVFAVFSGISFLLSDHKDVALTGAKEWYMGLLTILILCALIYLIGILWIPNVYVAYMMLAASVIVYILGILDRFSLYVIPLSVRDPSFISTLGNINWFAGYYCVMTTMGIGMLLMDGRKIFLYIYAAIAFVCGFAQGAESVFLYFAVFFALLLYLSGKGVIKFMDYMVLLTMWCLSAQAVRIVRLILPGYYNYSDSGLCSILSASNVTAIAAAVLIVMTLIFKDREKVLIRILWGLTAAGIIAYIILSVIKTNTGLLPSVTNSAFFFDERFGSGRGKAYGIAFMAIRHMNLKQILFGVGPDCFEEFVYSIEPVRAKIMEIWPNERLCCAHSSLLTVFINLGLLGTAAYLFIPFCFIRWDIKVLKGSKSLRTRAFLTSVALCVICLFMHDLISFSNLLNIPFIALLTGMAISQETLTFEPNTYTI